MKLNQFSLEVHASLENKYHLFLRISPTAQIIQTKSTFGPTPLILKPRQLQLSEPRNCLAYLPALSMKLIILYREYNSKLSVIHWISKQLPPNWKKKRFAKNHGSRCVFALSWFCTHIPIQLGINMNLTAQTNPYHITANSQANHDCTLCYGEGNFRQPVGGE